jgi:hypothetical protein
MILPPAHFGLGNRVESKNKGEFLCVFPGRKNRHPEYWKPDKRKEVGKCHGKAYQDQEAGRQYN